MGKLRLSDAETFKMAWDAFIEVLGEENEKAALLDLGDPGDTYWERLEDGSFRRIDPRNVTHFFARTE